VDVAGVVDAAPEGWARIDGIADVDYGRVEVNICLEIGDGNGGRADLGEIVLKRGRKLLAP
jgi:hypothetical protein